MKIDKSKRFTILEMLVVVAIVSMILSFTLVSYRNTKQKNRDSRREQDIKQIQNALALYVANTGFYPQCAEVVIGSTGDNCWDDALVPAGFISSAPRDPLLGVSGTCGIVGSYGYCYRAPGTGTPPRVYDLRYALEGNAILGKSPGWQDPIGP